MSDDPDFMLSAIGASFSLHIDYDQIPPEEDGFQWLTCHCSCSVDGFAAKFGLSVTRQDFEEFHAQLSRLGTGELNEVQIENIETDFQLTLTMKHTGAVTVAGQLEPISGRLAPGFGRSRASMTFSFDSDTASVDNAVRRLAAAIASARKLA